MSYIHFDKSSMVNLSYILDKEILRTNREGGYGATTLVGCNTSRYHGLLVVPQPAIDGDLHVLLSSLEESVIQHDEEFHLAVHQYKSGFFYPKGHKYISDVSCDPLPAITYQVGGVILKKERLNTFTGFRTMVKYTLLDAHSDSTLKIRPLMAFRNRHSLAKCNGDVDTSYEKIRGGIKCKMYQGYSHLYFQLNRPFEYLHAPDWYYDFEYTTDIECGYEGNEDLFSPGYFLVKMKVGESIILSVATDEYNPAFLSRLYNSEVSHRTHRDSFSGCLLNAAQQCIAKENGKYRVIAGYPWLGVIPRDTFIALPGLTLTQGKTDVFRNVIDNMIADMREPFFNFYDNINSAPVPSADASLWLLWCLGEYTREVEDGKKFVWKRWGKTIRMILNKYRDGTENDIYANSNGLIHQGRRGLALTWMNAMIDGRPVTPRTGFTVEMNALWYNAICMSIEMAKAASDTEFVEKWSPYLKQVGDSFIQEFWDDSKGYLCDFFEAGEEKNWLIRPNQLIAIGLHFSPLSEIMKSKVLQVVHDELLTPHGIRTLSPRYDNYKPSCRGKFTSNSLNKHQGSAYPWLLIFYAESVLSLYGSNRGINQLKKIVADFESEMMERGIGTISEAYDGNPPYSGAGTISHATNIAALLWITNRINNFESTK